MMVRVSPEEKRTCWESGDQATLYTGEEVVARVDLNMPDLDQILTAPSSPPVTMPAPSQLQRAARQAPR